MNQFFRISLVCLSIASSGCVAVLNTWHLSGEHYEKRDSKPLIIVGPEMGDFWLGVPFVLEYYADVLPFGLNVKYITHNVVANPVVRVDQAIIRMADGKEIDIADALRSKLALTTQMHHYIDDHGKSRVEKSLAGNVLVPRCIRSKSPFTLHLTGVMSSGGQIVERFDATMRFVPDSAHSKISVHNRVFSE